MIKFNLGTGLQARTGVLATSHAKALFVARKTRPI